ncbi:8-oxo-dGTP pyrophosphatase MutT, NUDIX family [Amycolatopsis arida]|uniref:8-oxo-dGTP pyrophosphatase MutT, NUDIX family n=1 Tax=Amycolatopsis arida TaxID=587909 RepID=A0A1I5ZI14_9PSEU|nr:NUDIX domain-containing protein [Amycolatopsis arida]TDX89676.1 8-oxo-dGTP pyrophosphatase MutT (NUDIX family) [Amycolatopsis arida]SFQ55777.1 8-oxo-dGTP pyrophosphatase MutT, NUDIX family [Amycolatopsis arida]
MGSGDELVARYSANGAMVGRARRAEVRARGLWHAAGVVLVRSGDGERVYVHRRSPGKDVFPGAYDCWAGGVVAAGETPAECARRELAEELGIRGVVPRPLFTHVYDVPPIRCHNFAFEVRWDGPIVHQPEEIVSGRWMPLAALREWADDPGAPLVPDGRLGLREWLRRFG